MRVLTYSGVEKLAHALEVDPRAADGKSIQQLCDELQLEFFELGLELEPNAKRGLLSIDVSKANFSDLCLLVRKSVGAIDYSIARDGRFWLSLVFGPLGRLAELPKKGTNDELLSWISNHWYSQSTRALFRSHAISKYWWTYELLSRQGDLSVEEALGLFDGQQDLRTQIMDRSSINSNSRLIGKILRILRDELESGWQYDREAVRLLLKYLNFDLGRRELEVLPGNKISVVVSETWTVAKDDAIKAKKDRLGAT
jgi:hypothetical protein